MGYEKWFEDHYKKHKKIVDKLSYLSDDELIDYFDYENISKKEVDFCPLFKDGKKCHDIERLNCYLCGCVNFRFDDDSKKVKSFCIIDSKDGSAITHNGFVHQDCSGCIIPHKKKFIKSVFSRDWKKMMRFVKSFVQYCP